MCYPKPGPRCSAHAAKKLVQATTAVKTYQRNLTDPSDYDAYQKVKETALQAQNEYDATPAGMRYLKRKIETGQGRKGEFELRLQMGELRRAEALAAIKAEDEGDKGHVFSVAESEQELVNRFRSSSKEFLEAGEERPSWKNDSAEIQGMIVESARWMNSIDADEAEAVAWFTSDGAGTINAEILGQEDDYGRGRYSREKVQNSIALLDSALSKYTAEEPVVVYRGLGNHSFPKDLKFEDIETPEGEANMMEYLATAYPAGSVIQNEAYMSTSYDSQRAVRFASRQVMMEIKTRKAAPVCNISAWEIAEREALLPRNTKLKVVGIQKRATYGTNITGNPHYGIAIQLEEVED